MYWVCTIHAHERVGDALKIKCRMHLSHQVIDAAYRYETAYQAPEAHPPRLV